MGDTDLRARSASEIVDAAFALYRQHALQFIVVTAIATAPSIIYSLLMSGGAQPVTPEEVLNQLREQLPVILVSLISYTLVGAVISRMASDVYLGRQPDVADTVRVVARRLPAILLALIVLLLLTMIAAVFLLVPAVWVTAMFFATIPIIVIEQKGPFTAMARSARLSKGLKLHILGTLALAMGIYFVLTMGLSAGSMAIGGKLVQIIVMSVFGIVVGPIVNLALMVLYYDTRIRREGFDVEHMAQTLNAPPFAESMGSSVR